MNPVEIRQKEWIIKKHQVVKAKKHFSEVYLSEMCFSVSSLTHNAVGHLPCIMKKTKISSLQRLAGLLISQFMPSVHKIAKEISLIKPESNQITKNA